MSPKPISDEKFLARERELIAIARSLVEHDCLTTLTIDKLVAAAPYSKGTIYKHFVSKEDLLLAICNTCMEEIADITARGLGYSGNCRERLLGALVAYIIWAKLNPALLFAVLSAHSPSVALCASATRNECHFENESKLMSAMNGLISMAIENKNFVLPAGMTYEQVTFALWSATWGAMALIMSKGNSIKLKPMILERETFTNANLLLDGFNWKPLSHEFDYRESVKKIAESMFSEELLQLEAKGTPFIFV